MSKGAQQSRGSSVYFNEFSFSRRVQASGIVMRLEMGGVAPTLPGWLEVPHWRGHLKKVASLKT